MATVTTSTSSSISDIEGYSFFGSIMYGDNGDPEGMPEYVVGSSDTNNVDGFNTWTQDPENGVDTNDIPFDLTGNPKGGSNGVVLNLQNSESGPLTFTGASYGAIQSVQIQAGVTLAGCRMTFTGVTVTFYKSGTETDSVTLQAGYNPVADATSATDPVAVQQLTIITPASQTNDMVVITGSVQLYANAGVWPGETDIFGDIYVFA
jgi:hypothetical protein